MKRKKHSFHRISQFCLPLCMAGVCLLDYGSPGQTFAQLQFSESPAVDSQAAPLPIDSTLPEPSIDRLPTDQAYADQTLPSDSTTVDQYSTNRDHLGITDSRDLMSIGRSSDQMPAGQAAFGQQPPSNTSSPMSQSPAFSGQPKIVQHSRVLRLTADDPDQQIPVISSVAIASDGNLLATSGDDHKIRLWNPVNGQLVRVLNGHQDWVRGAAFHPDGSKVFTSCRDRTVKVWDTNSGYEQQTLHAPPRGTGTLSVSPDGQLLAVAGFEPKACLYRTTDGTLHARLDAPGYDMRSVAFSPDSTLVATAGRSGKVRIWNAGTGSLLHELDGDNRRVDVLAWSPDGQTLASGGEGKSITLWNVAMVEPLKVLPQRPGEIRSLCYYDNGHLAAGYTDNRIRIWDLNSGNEIINLLGHTGTISTLAYDPQRNELISGSFDTTVRFWTLDDPVAGRTF